MFTKREKEKKIRKDYNNKYNNTDKDLLDALDFRKKITQEKTNKLINDLEKLDFNNHELILNWLCDLQNASDTKKVFTDEFSFLGCEKSRKDNAYFFDKKNVLSVFESHGFKIKALNGIILDPLNLYTDNKHVPNIKHTISKILFFLMRDGKIEEDIHIYTNRRKDSLIKQENESKSNKLIDVL